MSEPSKYELAARAAGWKTSDSGAYLMAPIAYQDLKGSVQHYNDGHAFIDYEDGMAWEYACEVSGLEVKPDSFDVDTWEITRQDGDK